MKRLNMDKKNEDFGYNEMGESCKLRSGGVSEKQYMRKLRV